MLTTASAFASDIAKVLVTTSDSNCTLILRISSSYNYDDVKIAKAIFYVIKPVKFQSLPENLPENLIATNNSNKDILDYSDFVLSNVTKPIARTIRGSNFILRSIFGVTEPVYSIRINGEKAVDVPISDTGIFLLENAPHPDIKFTYHLNIDNEISVFAGVAVPIKNSNLSILISELAYPISRDSKSFLRVEKTNEWFQPKELKPLDLDLLSFNHGLDIKSFNLDLLSDVPTKKNEKQKTVSYQQIENYAINKLGARFLHGRYMNQKLEIPLLDQSRLDSIKGFSVPGTPICSWQHTK